MEQQFGWAGRILHVDLTACTTTTLATADYSDRFIGGLGIAAKIYWDRSDPAAGAFDPQALLLMMTGPLCGTGAPSAPRMVVCGKSPCTYPERFTIASTAGFFPAELKKAGFDGIVLTGRADAPLYLVIEDGVAVLRDAARLWGLTNSAACALLAAELGDEYLLLSIGPGAEACSRIGTIMIDNAGSASMGFGSVLGSKRLKAIAVKGSGRPAAADPASLQQIRRQLRRMTGAGFFNLYGRSPIPIQGAEVVKKVHCHGCPQGCWRSLQRHASGREGIRKCQTGTFYAKWDTALHGAMTEATFAATDIANDYSLCVLELLFLMLWLDRAREQGIVDEQQAGLPLADMGSIDFFERFAAAVSAREGFGRVLAEGALRASAELGPQSRAITAAFLNQYGRAATYNPKSFILTGPIHAVEQRPAITALHEICWPLTKWALWLKTGGAGSYVSTDVLRGIAARFWGGAEAVDFSTYRGKARAAMLVQNRQYAKECLALCDLVFPVLDDAEASGHVGDPTMESRLLSAVSGRTVTEQELNRTGERVFNLNRAILLREGRAGRADDYIPDFCYLERAEPPSDIFDMYNPERLLPGAGDELISHKATPVDRSGFEKLMDEYYSLRGWDVASGLLRKEGLAEIGLADIIPELAQRDLLAK